MRLVVIHELEVEVDEVDHCLQNFPVPRLLERTPNLMQ